MYNTKWDTHHLERGKLFVQKKLWKNPFSDSYTNKFWQCKVNYGVYFCLVWALDLWQQLSFVSKNLQ